MTKITAAVVGLLVATLIKSPEAVEVSQSSVKGWQAAIAATGYKIAGPLYVTEQESTLPTNSQSSQGSQKGAPGGFVLRISLIDFFMIQRGLMLLPDEHARETLASIRAQMQEAVAPKK